MTLEIIADNAGAAAASVGALYFDTDGDPVQRTAEGWRRGLLWYFAAGSLQQPRWEPLADQLPRCYPWRPAATGQPADLSIEVAARLCVGAEGFPAKVGGTPLEYQVDVSPETLRAYLHLTPAGREVFERAMAMVHQRNQDIFGCLSDKEQATLSAMFDRLIAHARPH